MINCTKFILIGSEVEGRKDMSVDFFHSFFKNNTVSGCFYSSLNFPEYVKIKMILMFFCKSHVFYV